MFPASSDRKAAAERPHLVLTGFRAFPGVAANPTEALVEHFRTHPAGLPRAHHLALLDVDYRTAGGALDRLLALEPAALVLTGFSGKATRITLEAQATQLCAADQGDICGYVPRGADKPGAPLSTTANLDALHSVLQRQGLPAEISRDAGQYLCNFSYRHAMAQVASLGLRTRVLFVHIPALEGTPLAETSAAAMALDDAARALALIARELAGQA